MSPTSSGRLLFGTSDVGKPKARSAQDALADLNPDIQIETYETKLTSDNALDLFKDYDIVVDGTDNFPTRYLVNDACVLLGKPNVYGSIFRFEGQVTVFGIPDGPCYRCLYPEPPPPGLVPSCAEGGVLGVLPGHRRLDSGHGNDQADPGHRRQPLVGRCCSSMRWAMKFRELKLRKNPDCPVCGEHPTINELIDYYEFCGIRGEEADAAPTCMSGDDSTRIEVTAGSRRRSLHPRRARAARISDLQSQGALIPLGELPRRVTNSTRSREIVAHCRSGKRSADAVDS